MSENSVIICKPTQWIKVRAVLIIIMFGVFSYLFYSDGVVGYREKNEHYIYHQLFNSVVPNAVDSIDSEKEWKQLVASKTLEIPSAEDCPLPVDFDESQTWPLILGENYDILKNENTGANTVWVQFSGSKGWAQEPAEHLEDQSSINTQYYMAYGCAGLVLIVAFLFVRTLTRTMEVTDTSFIAPGGKVIPYVAMRRIDIRKWDTKGVALIEYELDGSKGKTKVDGMIYGQFKKEDDQPAERLYEFLMEHFKGELIEFENADEDDTTEAEGDNKISDNATNS